METFAQHTLKGSKSRLGLTSLSSFTLTIHPSTINESFTESIIALLSPCPLSHFQIYASSGNGLTNTSFDEYLESGSDSELHPLDEDRERQALVNDMCTRVLDIHGPRLRRFGFHRIRLSMNVVEEVCRKCTGLEQLFMLIDPEDLVNYFLTFMTRFLILVVTKPRSLAQEKYAVILSLAKSLRTVHINFTRRLETDDPREDAMVVVRQCSPTVRQLGVETRVWDVSFSFRFSEIVPAEIGYILLFRYVVDTKYLDV